MGSRNKKRKYCRSWLGLRMNEYINLNKSKIYINKDYDNK